MHHPCMRAQGRRLFKHLDRRALGRALAELETRWVEETLRGLLACPLASREKQERSAFQNATFERLVKTGSVSLPEHLLQALCRLHGHGHTQPLLRGLDATLPAASPLTGRSVARCLLPPWREKLCPTPGRLRSASQRNRRGWVPELLRV